MLLALKVGSFTVALESNVHFKMKKHNITQKELFNIIKENMSEIEILPVREEALIIGNKLYGIWVAKDKKRIIIKDIVTII